MKHDQQSSVRRFFASRTFLIIALAVMTVFAFGFARAYYQDYKVKREIRQLEDELSRLEKRKLESVEILKYVTSNTYVEDAARTELNMQAPAEHVIFLQDTQDNSAIQDSVGEVAIEDGQNMPNPVKWFYYFIHKQPLEEEH